MTLGVAATEQRDRNQAPPILCVPHLLPETVILGAPPMLMRLDPQGCTVPCWLMWG
jgi:hypothetical protein